MKRTRQRKPARLITDRAKRYRANAQRPAGDRCVYCGKPAKRLDVDHISGNEADGRADNLALACRSCNVQKGRAFIRSRMGRRTRQFNPAAEGARSVFEWVRAVMTLRGWAQTGLTLGEARDVVRATPPEDRSRFAKEIWRRRRARAAA
jgi:hypothetical protein